MKWIYGETHNVLLGETRTYKINPKYVIAVDLNKRVMLVQDIDCPIYYTEDWDNIIYDMVSGGDE